MSAPRMRAPLVLLMATTLSACESLAVLELFPAEPDGGVDGGSTGHMPPGPTAPAPSADDAGAGGAPAEVVSVPRPLHRYAFDGEGTIAVDSTSAADGEIVGGASLDGSGVLSLDGQDDFVDLPNGLLSGLTSTTLVVWAAWGGTTCWHRIFDFGSTDAGEGVVGSATTTLFLTPEPCPPSGPLVIFTVQPTEFSAGTATPAVPGERQFYAVVVDGVASTLSLFIDGAQADVAELGLVLSDLSDVNNWLGRSQWVQDYNFDGELHEFRIHDVALDARQIARLYELGPDVLP